MIVRELLVKFGVKVDKESTKKAETMQDKLLKAAKALAAAWTVTKIATGIRDIVAETAALADQFDKASQRIGITSRNLQRLSFVAEQSGVATDVLQDSMKDMNKNVGEALSGNEGLVKVFKKLRVNLKDTNGQMKPTISIFKNVIDRLRAIPNVAQRSAEAMKIFGEAGFRIMPIINSGSKAVEGLIEEFDQLGGTIDKNLMASGVRFTDNMSKMRQVLQGVKNTIAKALLPQINKTTEAFIEWWKINQKWIRQYLGRAIEIVSNALSGVWDVLKFVIEGWNELRKLLYDSIPGFKQLSIAIAILAAVLGSPAILITAIVLALGDIIKWFKDDGGRTVLGDMIGSFKELKDAWNAAALKGESGFLGIIDLMSKRIKGLNYTIRDIIKTFKELFSLRGVMSIFSKVDLAEIQKMASAQTKNLISGLPSVAKTTVAAASPAAALAARTSENLTKKDIAMTFYTTIQGMAEEGGFLTREIKNAFDAFAPKVAAAAGGL
jgi:hypothetical protein